MSAQSSPPPHHIIGLAAQDIRPHGMVNQPLRRPDMIGREFYCRGAGEEFPPGRWRVRRIVGNEYLCVRVSGDDRPRGSKVENFDIGYVHHAYNKEQQRIREQGPMTLARSAE